MRLLLALFLGLAPLASLHSDVVVDVAVIAGGAGSGGSYSGGAGAGGVITRAAKTLNQNTYTVTIGPGGTGGAAGARGTNGTASSFADLTATGGGNSGLNAGGLEAGANGGSGGGGGAGAPPTYGGGIGSQGYNGGGGNGSFNAGGGGGFSAGGMTATALLGGDGGAGLTTDWRTGASESFACGGGGGSFVDTVNPGAPGGCASAGTGGVRTGDVPTAGASNSGSGAGGCAGHAGGGAAGGSGRVFLRYLTANYVGGLGGTITQVGAYTVHDFTSSGTFTIPVPVSGTRTMYIGDGFKMELNSSNGGGL